jgi:hypothetical protein
LKFKALPVQEFTDATLDFEQLQQKTILDSTPQSFLQLATTGTRKVAFGAGTFVFTASATSAIVTITHGLGVTPITVILTCGNTGLLIAPYYGTPSGTVSVQTIAVASAATTVNVPFSWLMIG